MSYKKSAEEILKAIGGEENLDAMAHLSLIHISEPTRPY